jgi:hypothetical protein
MNEPRKPRKAVGASGRLWAERDGGVLVYVTIAIAVLVGFVGLALDFGRISTTNSQAQAAADASALAAASQLDGRPSAIDRAILAAQTTPLVQNEQSLADAEPDSLVEIASIRFLKSLPADDTDPITADNETTDPSLARYVEVTTEGLTQNNMFITAVGASPTGTTAATAVAGYKVGVCQIPPLMMCNPFETATYTGFPIDSVKGVTMLAKTKSQGSENAFVPGDMGLLDPPQYDFDTGTNTGAKEVAEEIAKATPPFCFSSPVELRPGQVDSMRNALNTSFDMYENPFFGGGSARSDPQFRPARNVTKGKITTVDSCTTADAPGVAMALPVDSCLVPGPCATSAAPSLTNRIGDGVWDRAGYWGMNHPGVPLPAVLADASRHDTYRYEIDEGMIPDNSPGGGEDGNPQCYTGPTAPNDRPDRRVRYVAVINCIEEGPLTGSSNANVTVLNYVKMFLIKPIESGSDTDVWLEFVDLALPGRDEAVHVIVQLYR